MQKFGKVAQSTGKTSSFVKTFVNMFVHLRDLGAVSNRVELLTKDEVVTFVDDKTGIIIRIDKPKNWHTMTDKHKKGFIAEETQKQINLLLAQKHGYDIDQTSSGTHPSSSKGPDIFKHEEIWLGQSSDQSDTELGIRSQVYESKYTEATITEGSAGSLDKSVSKNKGMQQMREEKGEHFEEVNKQQAEIINKILDKGTSVPIKDSNPLKTTAVGFSPNIKQSDKEGPITTDSQILYETPKEVTKGVMEAFSDPEKSPHVQIDLDDNDG